MLAETAFKANERIRGNNGREYQILGNGAIKQGGFASIYKAHASSDNVGLVAIKAINLDNRKIRRSEHEKRIQSEVKIHKGLEDHPRVIRFIDCFHYERDANVFCIVTEYAENGDLKDYLRRQGGQKLSEPEASRIVSQIVDGILFFQKNNLVHRDFKLQNILLDKEKNIKIADFGLATELQSKNDKMKTFCGTPNYLPPEVIARRGYSAKCDIWSLGILLYHLLVGRPPFESGETSKETMKFIQQNEIHYPELMSEYAKDIIRRTLAKDERDRITIGELNDHPFLGAHRTASSLESNHKSQLSDFQSNSQYKQQQLYPTPQSTPSRSYKEPEQRRLRCPSLERLPSGEIMPPPIANISNGSNSTNHKSTGYSSSMSGDNHTSPKYKAQLSPRLFPKPNLHVRSRSTGSMRRRSSSLTNSRPMTVASDETVPEISVRRLVPTKVKTKKTVCSIRPDEKAYVEQLDNHSNIKYCLEVDCRTQSAVYYTPRDFQGRPLPLGTVPYPPREDYAPEHYYYPAIPKKVLKMWQHLFKFVELVKAKTPKIKIFTDRGQAIMTETGDFELIAYDGAKYLKTASKEQFTDGQRREFDLNEVEVKNSEALAQIQHGRQQLSSCRLIEEAIEKIMATSSNGNFEYFPVVLGRRSRVTSEVPLRPERAASAPLRQRSPLVVHHEHHSNLVPLLGGGSTCPITPPSSIAPSTTAGGSAGSSSSRHQHKSKVIKEVDFKQFNPDSPVHYACLRSNGTVEFQSEKYYFFDKLQKQEIRVRNGNTYFYEENEIKGSVPSEIRPILVYWLLTGRQFILPG